MTAIISHPRKSRKCLLPSIRIVRIIIYQINYIDRKQSAVEFLSKTPTSRSQIVDKKWVVSHHSGRRLQFALLIKRICHIFILKVDVKNPSIDLKILIKRCSLQFDTKYIQVISFEILADTLLISSCLARLKAPQVLS